MPEPTKASAQGTISKLTKDVSKNDKIYYKLGLSGHDKTFFVWDRNIVDKPGAVEGCDVLIEYKPGDYPEVTKLEVLAGAVQTTVNGKQEHTDHQVIKPAQFRTAPQIIRTEALKAAVSWAMSLTSTDYKMKDEIFEIAQDMEAYIASGKVPETKAKEADDNASGQDQGQK